MIFLCFGSAQQPNAISLLLWSDVDEFDLLLSKLRGKVRIRMGQNEHPSLGIADSQSVRWGNNR